jgi:hypothetical protein
MALSSMTNTEKGGDNNNNKVSLENKENTSTSTLGSTSTSASVSDAISAAAAASNPTQTRFSFYDAAEVQLQISGSDSNKEEEDAAKKNRYNFYNAGEFEQEQSLLKLQQLQQEQEQAAKTDDETEDILRSLQETEEQRMQILQVDVNLAPTPTAASTSTSAVRKTRRMTPSAASVPKKEEDQDQDWEDDGSNPYEDAIKEALDLLRRHRSPAESPTVVVTGGPGDLQQQQEQSDDRSPTPPEYDRLLQMRQDSDDDASDHHVQHQQQQQNEQQQQQAQELQQESEDITKDLVEEQKLKAKQRQERMAQYASRLQEFKSSLPAADAAVGKKVPAASDSDSLLSVLSQSTKQRDEEVQRGVEKVLLAILEKAHTSTTSRGRAEPKGRIPQETMNDALLRAMDELLQGQGQQKTSDEEEMPMPLKTKSMDSNPSKLSERSVVDELLAEEEEDGGMAVNSMRSKRSKESSAWSAKCEEEKKVHDSMEQVQEEEGNSNHDHDHDDDDTISMDKYATTEQYEESEETEAVTEDEYSKEQEQDGDYDDHDPQNDSQDTDRVLGPLSKRSGGTTGVVLDIPDNDDDDDGEDDDDDDDNDDDDDDDNDNDDDYASDHSVEETADGTAGYSSSNQEANKYATSQDDDAEIDEDKEAAELMRTLCAHLLPFGVDSSNRLRQDIPAWDDENPNEAGYRIIRLSKSQLRRVESAFESMIKEFKQQSEERLNDKDAPTLNGFDANFYKDLQEAERLLDNEELRVRASSGPKALAHDAHDFDKASAISVETNYSQCHPDFPGIKATGKGEMGDLEYFHLPIIFKSHVTGFEPTKEMALEPGNVVAGQYLVENELGSAAFSTAYRCIDLSSEMQGVR